MKKYWLPSLRFSFVFYSPASTGARTFPARSFPPDGTTFSQITLGQKQSKVIQPYSYWNMQFYQSEPAYVKFLYNIPRGASIGVYARRNALPTHTQYHFKEILSGLTARTTRSTHVSHAQFARPVAPQIKMKRVFIGSLCFRFGCVENRADAAIGQPRGHAVHGARPLVHFDIQWWRWRARSHFPRIGCWGYDAKLSERLLWQRSMLTGSLPMQSRIRGRRLQRK